MKKETKIATLAGAGGILAGLSLAPIMNTLFALAGTAWASFGEPQREYLFPSTFKGMKGERSNTAVRTLKSES